MPLSLVDPLPVAHKADTSYFGVRLQKVGRIRHLPTYLGSPGPWVLLGSSWKVQKSIRVEISIVEWARTPLLRISSPDPTNRSFDFGRRLLPQPPTTLVLLVSSPRPGQNDLPTFCVLGQPLVSSMRRSWQAERGGQPVVPSTMTGRPTYSMPISGLHGQRATSDGRHELHLRWRRRGGDCSRIPLCASSLERGKK